MTKWFLIMTIVVFFNRDCWLEHEVKLTRESGSLGFSIAGGKSSLHGDQPIFIKSVRSGSAAHKENIRWASVCKSMRFYKGKAFMFFLANAFDWFKNTSASAKHFLLVYNWLNLLQTWRHHHISKQSTNNGLVTYRCSCFT